MTSAGSEPLTVATFWAGISGQPLDDGILDWPPDVVALTAAVLERAHVFRFVVSPPENRAWPPDDRWNQTVACAAEQWIAWIEGRADGPPAAVTGAWKTLVSLAATPLDQVAGGDPWDLCQAVLVLHTIGDEACAGFAARRTALPNRGCLYRGRGREVLARTGSLSRVAVDRLRLLPKVRTPTAGITHRSLSRYTSLHLDGLGVAWHKAPARQRGTDPRAQRANVLLLPWPLQVRDADFRPRPESIKRPHREPYGFFDYAPADPLDLDLVDRLLGVALEEVDSVDAVVLPEEAVDDAMLGELEDVLARRRTPLLIAGTRTRPATSGGTPGNTVHIGVLLGGCWWHYRHAKHHRWYLDEGQIEQYGLGAVLDPRVRWWEAMDVPQRSMEFLELGEGVTLAAVICEDLARLDGVAEMLRSVGATLVIVLLLDGPQLGSRWTARYATVLADDPGSAVLTLTAYGMVRRSTVPDRPPSRAVAMWKDPKTGLREISLDEGAQAVLLTVAVDPATRHSADGRHPTDDGADLRVVDIRPLDANNRSPSEGPAAPEPRSVDLDGAGLSLLVGWAETVAEAVLCGRAAVDRVLADASGGAAWREGFCLADPSADGGAALSTLVALVHGIADDGMPLSLPSALSRLTTVPSGRDPLTRLVRRILRTALESAGRA